MKKIKRIVQTRFNNETRTAGKWDNPEWIYYRWDLMIHTTAHALSRQDTDKNFTWLILYHPETEAIISELADTLPDFALTCSDYPTYRQMVRGLETFDYVQEIRIDSDDVFSPDTLRHFFSRDKVDAAYLRRGYVYNLITGELAEGVFDNGASPAFICYYFPADSWAYMREAWLMMRGGTDNTVASRFERSAGLWIPEYGIIYTGDNATNQWINHAGKMVSDPKEKKRIMQTLGFEGLERFRDIPPYMK